MLWLPNDFALRTPKIRNSIPTTPLNAASIRIADQTGCLCPVNTPRLKPMATPLPLPRTPVTHTAACRVRRFAPPLLALLVCALLLAGLQRLALTLSLLDYHAIIKHLCRLPA